MRHLREIHPAYADRVAVLAVDVDPSETAEEILSYQMNEGFTWPMTTADADMLRSYNVTRQAGYVTVDADGVIASSIRYGSENTESWRAVFEALVGP